MGKPAYFCRKEGKTMQIKHTSPLGTEGISPRKQAIINDFATMVTDLDENFLAKHLERVAWGYALYLLKDTETCGGSTDGAEALYFTKELIDILKQ